MDDTDWVAKFTSEFKDEHGDLADEFFRKDTENAVEFEIALAALLATLCLQYPVNGLGIPVSQISAFSILTVTIVRRVAVSSPYAPDDILQKTVPLIEIATTSCLLSVFSATAMNDLFSVIRPSFAFILISLSTMMLLLVLHEYIFRDYLIWWHAKMLEKSEESEYFSDLWASVSIVSLIYSKYYRGLSDGDKFRKELPSKQSVYDNFEFGIKQWSRVVIRAVLLFTFLYALPAIVTTVTFGVWGLFIIPSVVVVHNQSAFWYVGYGETSYEDFRRHPWTIIAFTSFYILEVGYLLKYYSLKSAINSVHDPFSLLFIFPY